MSLGSVLLSAPQVRTHVSTYKHLQVACTAAASSSEQQRGILSRIDIRLRVTKFVLICVFVDVLVIAFSGILTWLLFVLGQLLSSLTTLPSNALQ